MDLFFSWVNTKKQICVCLFLDHWIDFSSQKKTLYFCRAENCNRSITLNWNTSKCTFLYFQCTIVSYSVWLSDIYITHFYSDNSFNFIWIQSEIISVNTVVSGFYSHTDSVSSLAVLSRIGCFECFSLTYTNLETNKTMFDPEMFSFACSLPCWI